MKRRFVILLVLAAAAILAWFVTRDQISLERLADRERRLRELLDAHPLIGLVVGFVVYALLSLIPGTLGKSVVYGWLFGFWRGVLIVNCSLTAAAVATFLLSRYLLQDVVQSRLGTYLRFLERAIERDGAFYLFALRMMHAPYSLTNYTLGTSSMHMRSFWWATQLGMLPGNCVFVYAGTQLPTLREAARGLENVITPQLIAAFALTGVFPLLARCGLRRVFAGRRATDSDPAAWEPRG